MNAFEIIDKYVANAIQVIRGNWHYLLAALVIGFIIGAVVT